MKTNTKIYIAVYIARGKPAQKNNGIYYASGIHSVLKVRTCVQSYSSDDCYFKIAEYLFNNLTEYFKLM